MKTPSFKGLEPSSSVASRIKSATRATGTGPEVMLRSALWRRGLRFRRNKKNLPGKPDVVFAGPKLAVFCDGDFWHGKDWEVRREKLLCGSNPEYWIAKIESNMARDTRVRSELEAMGWRVVRVWESEVRRDTSAIADQIEELVRAGPRGLPDP